jgi:5-methylcytosine-specific restriction enzyme subunit McrC
MALGPEDGALLKSLTGGTDTRLGLDELRAGLRITSRSWVGVVRFKDFELRIVPKLAGGDIGLLRMVDFATGLDAVDRHPAVHTFAAEGASLLDLITLLLTEACERIIRAGMLADYQELEDDLPVVRGQLLVREQVLRRMGRVDRVVCRYDEHTTDTIDNRLLLAALSVAGSRVTHPDVALRVRRLHGVLADACSVDDLDLRMARSTLTYNRLNEHYQEAHQLAWLVLEGLGIEDLYAGGSHRTFAFLLDMNRLFEDFVTRWLAALLRGTHYRSIAQRRDRTILWNADLNRPYAKVIPDLVVERKDKPGRFLPLDAKYKLYEERRISPADIYQTFMYAYAYGQTHAVLPSAVIIYPAQTDTAQVQRLHVRRADGLPSAQIVGIGIDVLAALDEAFAMQPGNIGSRLLQQIGTALD